MFRMVLITLALLNSKRRLILELNTTVVLDELYDIVVLDDGKIALDDGFDGYASMLDLDFSSFNDWELNSRLGLNWANDENTGILQFKNNEELVMGAIMNKLNSIPYIKEVREIAINVDKDKRSGSVSAEILTIDDEIIIVENSIGG